MLSVVFSYLVLDWFCSYQYLCVRYQATSEMVFSLSWFFAFGSIFIIMIYVCYSYLPYLPLTATEDERDSKEKYGEHWNGENYSKFI